MKTLNSYIGKISDRQNGQCPHCKQLIQAEEEHYLHHLDGDKTNRGIRNVLMLHKTCKKAFEFVRGKIESGASIIMGVSNA